MVKGKGRPARRMTRPSGERPGHLIPVPTHGPRGADPAVQPDLMATLRHVLRSDEPLDLLTLVSTLVIATRDQGGPIPQPQTARVNLATLVDSFIDANYAETTGALSIMAVILNEAPLVARIRRELLRRRQPMPDWISRFSEAGVSPQVWTMTDVLGDGDNYLLGLDLPGGRQLTAVVYVDVNMGGAVKDAFFVPAPPETVAQHFRDIGLSEGQAISLADPAWVRAIITEAITYGAMLYPPLESETWPMCQPLVEWLVRALPEGGVAPEVREWAQWELDEIAADFAASSHADGLDDPDHGNLLESVLWFASSYTGCDPYRWSPVRVEILLADWFPRKVIADAQYLSKMPLVLRAYIRYCQDRIAIPASRRQETLLAVDDWEPEYQRTIRTARLQGPAALIASIMPSLAEGWDEEADLDDFDLPTYMLGSLERCVGDRITLMNLDDTPLPDEPFSWVGIPEDIRPVVELVLADCDRVADEILDVELRTVMRRLLGRIATGDPTIFRRKASPARGAAAVGWLAYRANDDGQLQIQELVEAFGVSGSVSQRAEPMLRAIGVDPHQRYGLGYLGAADLLTASRRASIIAQRDYYLEMMQE